MEVALSFSVTDPKLPSFPQSGSLPRSQQTRRKQRYPHHPVICSASTNGLVLKPRPLLRPTSPTSPAQHMDPEESGDVNPPSMSSLCDQIQRLVVLRRYKEALDLFKVVRAARHAVALEANAYYSLMTACVALSRTQTAKMVYEHMLSNGFEFDQYAWNRVLLMLVKCRMMKHARLLFDEMPTRNVVTWNTMISGLLDEGCFAEAFHMFRMLWEGVSCMGVRMLVGGMRSSAGLGAVGAGRQLHSSAFKLGFSGDSFISCTLVDMYSKCGCIMEARWVFDEMPEKTLVGWNTIISGYAVNGYSEEALDLYFQMGRAGVKADGYSYSIILKVCARLASLLHGKQAHASLIRNGLGEDLFANTALVDFYCKWGRIEDARHVFNRMPHRNVISWNALIVGYGYRGKGEEAVQIFESMVKEGMVPNHVTFLAVLTACRYSGLIDKGWELFEAMFKDYDIKPRAMHYTCMIDLLGRKGLLGEAYSLIKEAPFSATCNMWAALLTACRAHNNLELAELVAEKLFMLESGKMGNYIVLSNIYNDSGRIDEAKVVLETMKGKGISSFPACSWIDIHKKPHQFLFQDRSHPLTDKIYKKLDELMEEVVKLGYVPDGKPLLPDVGEHEQRVPMYHSEKLAIAFGLLITSESISLQVVQSHRMCSDCHEVIKLFSLITKRVIVVRDSSRFHHFTNGVCSCGDYW